MSNRLDILHCDLTPVSNMASNLWVFNCLVRFFVTYNVNWQGISIYKRFPLLWLLLSSSSSPSPLSVSSTFNSTSAVTVPLFDTVPFLFIFPCRFRFILLLHSLTFFAPCIPWYLLIQFYCSLLVLLPFCCVLLFPVFLLIPQLSSLIFSAVLLWFPSLLLMTQLF